MQEYALWEIGSNSVSESLFACYGRTRPSSRESWRLGGDSGWWPALLSLTHVGNACHHAGFQRLSPWAPWSLPHTQHGWPGDLAVRPTRCPQLPGLHVPHGPGPVSQTWLLGKAAQNLPTFSGTGQSAGRGPVLSGSPCAPHRAAGPLPSRTPRPGPAHQSHGQPQPSPSPTHAGHDS